MKLPGTVLGGGVVVNVVVDVLAVCVGGNKKGVLALCPAPVSYTHLDVYKRQV